MQNIKISKQFLDLMDKVTKVTKAKQTLFFRDGDTCRMTIATKSMFVHLAGGLNDFHFDGDVVNSSSISEFVKYAKFINYPDKEGTSVFVDTELSMAGYAYEYIKFKSGNKLLRSITADPSCFNAMSRKVPCTREQDKMNLLATVTLNMDNLNDICQCIQMASGCEFVSANVTEDNVSFSMRGKVAQQADVKIDPNCTRILDEDAIKKAYGHGEVRMFLTDYFQTLKGLCYEAQATRKKNEQPPLEFDTEIRHIVTDKANIMSLKAFSTVVGADPERPISVYAGVSESASAAISNFDLVRSEWN